MIIIVIYACIILGIVGGFEACPYPPLPPDLSKMGAMRAASPFVVTNTYGVYSPSISTSIEVCNMLRMDVIVEVGGGGDLEPKSIAFWQSLSGGGGVEKLIGQQGPSIASPGGGMHRVSYSHVFNNIEGCKHLSPTGSLYSSVPQSSLTFPWHQLPPHNIRVPKYHTHPTSKRM
eukprot:GHVO01012653.1.p2 GENE.GHVO01012653.1~~GHVO01012653.1.p2  ORF type:complete len:174 (+),score=29.51 GHVO01012653.1:113-634(+)